MAKQKIYTGVGITPGELYGKIRVPREEFVTEEKLVKEKVHPYVRLCRDLFKRFPSLGKGAKFSPQFKEAIDFLGWDLKPQEFSAAVKAVLVAAIAVFGFLGGCMNSGSNPDNEPLIRVQDRILTVLDFNKVFEITKTAYPHNFKDEPEDFRNARLRLLNQLVVEMIILERAKELGLSISSEEIHKAVSEIKSDYPEDTFEKALLEFAVSYESWEARLKNRLLMQKVVDNELKSQIVITPEDIASFYERNYQATDADVESIKETKDINENIIKHLRQEKAEQAYQIWIKELKRKYSIEINNANWEKISGSKYREGQELEDEDSSQNSG